MISSIALISGYKKEKSQLHFLELYYSSKLNTIKSQDDFIIMLFNEYIAEEK